MMFMNNKKRNNEHIRHIRLNCNMILCKITSAGRGPSWKNRCD